MKKILLIDDEKKIRDLYKKILTGEGYAVTVVSDSKKAIDLLLIQDFDLVLLDLDMPMLDGAEMINIVKSYGIKIVFIVVSVYPVEEQEKIIPDAEDYFDKSENSDILLEKIKKAAGLRDELKIRFSPG